jgi:hypothetical protein
MLASLTDRRSPWILIKFVAQGHEYSATYLGSAAQEQRWEQSQAVESLVQSRYNGPLQRIVGVNSLYEVSIVQVPDYQEYKIKLSRTESDQVAFNETVGQSSCNTFCENKKRRIARSC